MPNKLEPSTVFVVPFKGHFATAKALYISEHITDCFGFVVLPHLFETRDVVEVKDGPYLHFKLGVGDLTVLHGFTRNITHDGLWDVIGQLPVKDTDMDLLVHGIGGNLYKCNEHLRPFKDIAERNAYPKVLNFGNDAVETVLEVGFQQAGLL